MKTFDKNFKDTPVASVMVETRLSRIVQSLRRFIERIFADFLPDSS